MDLGYNLVKARKKKGISQEEAAEHLGINQQAILKWETNETLPDVFQASQLAKLYGISLGELMGCDTQVQDIQRVIENTSEETQSKVNWTKVWSKKYPVLDQYQNEVDISKYADALKRLLNNLQAEYSYNQLDAMLVLKDILAKVWK